MLVSCLAYSLTLKTEATCSSEMLVDFQQTALCYIPGGQTLNNLICWQPSHIFSESVSCKSSEIAVISKFQEIKQMLWLFKVNAQLAKKKEL
jgi:hypothetical protein